MDDLDAAIADAVARYPRKRVRPLEAARALERLARDPGDTDQVSRLEIAVGGCSPSAVFMRFAASPHGRRVLAERRSLTRTLSDRARLRALPDRTLGAAYLRFVEREDLSAEGLMAATARYSRYLATLPELVRIFSDYTQRGAHDLHHVIGGYGRDGLGEACVLAMAYPQLRIPGYRVLATFAALAAPAVLREAARRGRRAAWLPAIDLEAALGDELDGFRRAIGLPPPVRYQERLQEARGGSVRPRTTAPGP